MYNTVYLVFFIIDPIKRDTVSNTTNEKRLSMNKRMQSNFVSVNAFKINDKTDRVEGWYAATRPCITNERTKYVYAGIHYTGLTAFFIRLPSW